MLTPEYLKNKPRAIVALFRDLEESVIADMSKSINKHLQMTETDEYQLKVLLESGYDVKRIERAINKKTILAAKESEKLMEDIARVAYDNDKKLYAKGNKHLPSMKHNKALEQMIEAIAIQTSNTFKNLSGSMGFVGLGGHYKPIKAFYQDTISQGVLEVTSGLYDYQTSVRKAVQNMGDRGLVTIDFESGVKRSIDSHARTTILTGMNQISGYISESNAVLMEQDLMEITAHAGARPSHSYWQGQIVSRSGQSGYLSLEDIGYNEVTGFKGANCRHDWFPYFLGISEPNYSVEELLMLDNEPFEYQGKVYTMYDATQKQRYIERKIRSSKRRLIGYQEAGLEKQFIQESIRLRKIRQEYVNFSNYADLEVDNSRHMTYKFNQSIAQKARWAVDSPR